jgi:apolipoprotein N-acyltransferase
MTQVKSSMFLIFLSTQISLLIYFFAPSKLIFLLSIVIGAALFALLTDREANAKHKIAGVAMSIVYAAVLILWIFRR